MSKKPCQKLSTVELLILAALTAREQYGLEIIRTVQEITRQTNALSLGGLYTTLHRMEQKGLVSARWGEVTETRQGARRRYYKITGLGHRVLTETKGLLVNTLKLIPGVSLLGV